MKLFTAKRFAGGLGLALASLWPGACEGKKEVPQNAAETVYELSVGQTGTGIKSSMVVLAKELGLYANEGLKVVFKDISSLNDGIVGIMSDKLDILPMGVIPTCTFYSQGADLAIFGGTIAEGSQLVTRPENFQTFQSLEGFRGRTIACVRQETGHMIMKGKLREAGILPGADLTFIELDGFQSVVQAVLKGEADAGFTNSGFGQNAVRQGLVVAFDTAHYAPDAVCCRQTASGEKLRNNSEPYIRFQTANLEAYKLYLEDRGRVIDTLTAYSGLERAYVENCMYDGVMKISMDPMKIRVGEFYQTMRDNGDIKAEAKQDISGAVETAVYREALERMHKRYPEWEEYEALLKAYNANN